MKIVHILYELKYSGAEIMYVDAAPLFQDKGCELTVIATAANLGEFAPNFERAGYKVIHNEYPKLIKYGNRLKYYREFTKFLKTENYDVVHIHYFKAMWGMALCAWLAGKKSVYTIHAISPTSWYSYFYHTLLRWSAKKIFKSRFHSIGDSVHDYELKLYGNRTTKIENWYGSDRYFPAKYGEKEQVRKELNIPYDAFVLISVGGCDHNKRHHDIINSLAIITKQIPEVFYLHLGTGYTEHDEKKLSEDLGIVNHIRFCGNQPNVRKYLIVSDVYIMTSRSEGLPITALEAMACNLPSIFYNVTGLRDFNNSGENTILIQEDFKVLAEKIYYLYSHPEIRMEIANNAKNMANKYYHMKKNVDQIYALYD